MNQFLSFLIEENPGILDNTDPHALGMAVIQFKRNLILGTIKPGTIEYEKARMIVDIRQKGKIMTDEEYRRIKRSLAL